MWKASLGKEIVVKTTHEVGALAKIAKIISEKGIDILAMSGWGEGLEGRIHMTVDDTLRAHEALDKAGFEVKESSSVLVEVFHKPGMLRHMTERLIEENINLIHLYATAMSDQKKCLVVFSSSNDQRAVVALNEKTGAFA